MKRKLNEPAEGVCQGSCSLVLIGVEPASELDGDVFFPVLLVENIPRVKSFSARLAVWQLYSLLPISWEDMTTVRAGFNNANL